MATNAKAGAVGPWRDAAWLMAEATNWVDHGSDGPPATIDILWERPAGREQAGPPPLYSCGSFATARWTQDQVLSLDKTHAVRLACAHAAPRVVYPRPDPCPHALTGPTWTDDQKNGNRRGTLMALIDDGCPFAAPAFRAGNAGTRLVALWDQNEASGNDRGGVPYGRAWGRNDLEHLLTSVDGDESAAYQCAGLGSLARRWTHGAFALARMAGRLRWEGFGDADDRWTGRQPVDDECAGADLAFVQLPEAVLQVVCTPAMEFHAFNAICQLVAWAKAGGYGRLVIAFPYETWLGSHDGRSWFERAIDACVQSAHADPSLAVGVVLPAGNGSHRRGHATPVQEGGDGRRLGLELSLAASSELPTWMELWLPGHWDLSHLSLEAKAPGAQQFHPLGLLSEDTLNPVGGLRVVVERALPVRQQNAPFRRRLLFRFSPTASAAGDVSPHGRWRIVLEHAERFHDVNDADFFAYLGRVQSGMGRPALAQQSWFTGDAVSATRTLNGHAGGNLVLVAGAALPQAFPYPLQGVSLQTGWQADYSGRPVASLRRVVDVQVGVEDGIYLPGQLGMGSRAEVAFRMSGTSVAAPTAARWLGNLDNWPDLSGQPGTPGWYIDRTWPFTTAPAAP